jgi:hypothetical protein
VVDTARKALVSARMETCAVLGCGSAGVIHDTKRPGRYCAFHAAPESVPPLVTIGYPRASDPAFIYMHEPLIEAAFDLATKVDVWDKAIFANHANEWGVGSNHAAVVVAAHDAKLALARYRDAFIAAATARTFVNYAPTNETAGNVPVQAAPQSPVGSIAESAEPLIARTKALSDQLHALMANQEPGLATWHSQVYATIRSLAGLLPPRDRTDR